MNTTRAEARTFTIATVAGSAIIWDIAFTLGVYDTIFFEKIFFVWATSLAVFFVSLVLPDEHAPVNWWGRIILILPTAWVLLTFLWEPSGTISIVDITLSIIGLVIFTLCLPYILYVVARITNPEFFALRSRRLGVALALILLLIAMTSYLIGRNNALFLTCEDFKVSGYDIPTNCAETLPIDPLLE